MPKNKRISPVKHVQQKESRKSSAGKDKIFQSVQEMFAGQLEGEVIHMVLEECDWIAEKAVDNLFAMCEPGIQTDTESKNRLAQIAFNVLCSDASSDTMSVSSHSSMASSEETSSSRSGFTKSYTNNSRENVLNSTEMEGAAGFDPSMIEFENLEKPTEEKSVDIMNQFCADAEAWMSSMDNIGVTVKGKDNTNFDSQSLQKHAANDLTTGPFVTHLMPETGISMPQLVSHDHTPKVDNEESQHNSSVGVSKEELNIQLPCRNIFKFQAMYKVRYSQRSNCLQGSHDQVTDNEMEQNILGFSADSPYLTFPYEDQIFISPEKLEYFNSKHFDVLGENACMESQTQEDSPSSLDIFNSDDYDNGYLNDIKSEFQNSGLTDNNFKTDVYTDDNKLIGRNSVKLENESGSFDEGNTEIVLSEKMTDLQTLHLFGSTGGDTSNDTSTVEPVNSLRNIGFDHNAGEATIKETSSCELNVDMQELDLEQNVEISSGDDSDLNISGSSSDSLNESLTRALDDSISITESLSVMDKNDNDEGFVRSQSCMSSQSEEELGEELTTALNKSVDVTSPGEESDIESSHVVSTTGTTSTAKTLPKLHDSDSDEKLCEFSHKTRMDKPEDVGGRESHTRSLDSLGLPNFMSALSVNACEFVPNVRQEVPLSTLFNVNADSNPNKPTFLTPKYVSPPKTNKPKFPPDCKSSQLPFSSGVQQTSPWVMPLRQCNPTTQCYQQSYSNIGHPPQEISQRPPPHWVSATPVPREAPPMKLTDIQEVETKIQAGHKCFVMLRGLPGSGKSTLARKLQHTGVKPGVILSSDDYFVQNGVYRFEPHLLSEAHEWNRLRTIQNLHNGSSPIVVDNTNTQAWEMKPYVKQAQKFGYEIYFLEPDTQWKFQPKELARRNTHGVPLSKIRQMLERYQKDLTVEQVLGKPAAQSNQHKKINKSHPGNVEDKAVHTENTNMAAHPRWRHPQNSLVQQYANSLGQAKKLQSQKPNVFAETQKIFTKKQETVTEDESQQVPFVSSIVTDELDSNQPQQSNQTPITNLNPFSSSQNSNENNNSISKEDWKVWEKLGLSDLVKKFSRDDHKKPEVVSSTVEMTGIDLNRGLPMDIQIGETSVVVENKEQENKHLEAIPADRAVELEKRCLETVPSDQTVNSSREDEIQESAVLKTEDTKISKSPGSHKGSMSSQSSHLRDVSPSSDSTFHTCCEMLTDQEEISSSIQEDQFTGSQDTSLDLSNSSSREEGSDVIIESDTTAIITDNTSETEPQDLSYNQQISNISDIPHLGTQNDSSRNTLEENRDTNKTPIDSQRVQTSYKGDPDTQKLRNDNLDIRKTPEDNVDAKKTPEDDDKKTSEDKIDAEKTPEESLDAQKTSEEDPCSQKTSENNPDAEKTPEDNLVAKTTPEEDPDTKKTPEDNLVAKATPEEDPDTKKTPEDNLVAKTAPEEDPDTKKTPEDNLVAKTAPEEDPDTKKTPEDNLVAKTAPEEDTDTQKTPEASIIQNISVDDPVSRVISSNVMDTKHKSVDDLNTQQTSSDVIEDGRSSNNATEDSAVSNTQTGTVEDIPQGVKDTVDGLIRDTIGSDLNYSLDYSVTANELKAILLFTDLNDEEKMMAEQYITYRLFGNRSKLGTQTSTQKMSDDETAQPSPVIQQERLSDNFSTAQNLDWEEPKPARKQRFSRRSDVKHLHDSSERKSDIEKSENESNKVSVKPELENQTASITESSMKQENIDVWTRPQRQREKRTRNYRTRGSSPTVDDKDQKMSTEMSKVASIAFQALSKEEQDDDVDWKMTTEKSKVTSIAFQALSKEEQDDDIDRKMTTEKSKVTSIACQALSKEEQDDVSQSSQSHSSLESSPSKPAKKKSNRRKLDPYKQGPFLESEVKDRVIGADWSFPVLAESVHKVEVSEKKLLHLLEKDSDITTRDVKVLNAINRGEDPTHLMAGSKCYHILVGHNKDINETNSNLVSSGVLDKSVMTQHCVDRGTMTEENLEADLDFLQSSFPTIPLEELSEVLRQCGNNLQWAINLLLDWKYNIPLSSDDKDKFVTRMFQLQKSPTVPKFSFSARPSPVVRSPSSLLDMCVGCVESQHIAPRQDVEHQIIMSSQQRLDSIEENIRLKRTHSRTFSQSVVPDEEFKENILNELMSMTEQANSDSTSDASDDKVVPQNQTDISYVESWTANQANDFARGPSVESSTSGQKSDEEAHDFQTLQSSAPVMSIQITTDTIQALQSQFGPVPHLSGVTGDVMVPLDYRTAQALHRCLMLTARQQTMDRQRQLLEDEAYARRLQDEEILTTRSRPPPSFQPPPVSLMHLSGAPQAQHKQPSTEQGVTSLKDIMEEEMERKKKKEEEQKLLEASGNHNVLATRLKRKKLYEQFPGIDETLLDDIYRDNSYNLDNTVLAIRGFLTHNSAPPKNVMTTEASEAYEEKLIAAAKQQSLQEMMDSCMYSPEETKAYQEHEDPDYDDFRAEANIHHRLRHECFQKAQEAYRRGMRDVASFYSKQGHGHSQKIKEANQRAAEKILQSRNSLLKDRSAVDLHGLHVEEAIEALERIIPEREEDLRTYPDKRKQHLVIITGRGSHSKGGIARIRPAVLRFLVTNGYKYSEIYKGCFKILLKYR
ncbi:LOW QUALITY PROTEIN: NEDD4-binding protein 2-like [Pecten maximus]|uniref:LOW QUALITY PROTEIN: NEDD4-binding protein 2-like n=1 Tax=Pecten maximus TaxID=6579 RepID=UPI001458B643|nr:LOW QUALITY PROTEIN: NEDD4-binding protein 2-like [Pecten maximus]